LSYPRAAIWTFGYSYDELERGPLDTENHNPKLGLQWDLTSSLRLRGAYFQTVKRALIVEQTLEPTQLAGFTQFFDQLGGTKMKTRGVGLDWKIFGNLFMGGEALHRDIDVPQVDIATDQVDFGDRDEDLVGGYVYWAPWSRVALTAGYDFNDVDNDGFGTTRPQKVRTRSVPVAVRYFSPVGLFAELGATRVSQNVRYEPAFTVENKDQFWVADVLVGYRLPKRWGIASVEVRNLFNEDFFYQDDNYRTSETVAPRFIPDRTVVGKLSLSF
jgi:outer membrane receptor protein involved in Fe transport